jgi:hypothetical protein
MHSGATRRAVVLLPALIQITGLLACGGGASSAPDSAPDARGGTCQRVVEPPITCGESTATNAVVHLLAGGKPEPAALVVSHRADGFVLGETTTDTQGCGTVATEPDGLITVVYVALFDETFVITSPARISGQLEIHGPRSIEAPAPCVAGTLTIPHGTEPAAESFHITLGIPDTNDSARPSCKEVSVAQLPATLDVPLTCLGADSNVDVVIAATSEVPGPAGPVTQPIAFTAGRVDLVDGQGELAVDSWIAAPVPQPVQVVVDPSISAAYEVSPRIEYVVDELTFYDSQFGASYVPGLAVDSVKLQVSVNDGSMRDNRVTTFRRPGLPGSIDVAPGDLLSPIADLQVFPDPNQLVLAWTPDPIVADALFMTLTWRDAPGGRPLQWLLVLPTAADHLTFPAVTDPRFFPPGAGLGPQGYRRYVDGDTIDGFAELSAAGLHLEGGGSFYSSTVVPLRTPEIRTCFAHVY